MSSPVTQAYHGRFYPNGVGGAGMEEVVLKENRSASGQDNKAKLYKSQVRAACSEGRASPGCFCVLFVIRAFLRPVMQTAV